MRRGQPTDRIPFLDDTRARRHPRVPIDRFSAGAACHVAWLRVREEVAALECAADCRGLITVWLQVQDPARAPPNQICADHERTTRFREPQSRPPLRRPDHGGRDEGGFRKEGSRRKDPRSRCGDLRGLEFPDDRVTEALPNLRRRLPRHCPAASAFSKVKCRRCATHSLIDLSVVKDVRRRPETTPIWKFEASLRCRHCTEASPGRKWKPAANLVRLRREQTLEFERWHPEDER